MSAGAFTRSGAERKEVYEQNQKLGAKSDQHGATRVPKATNIKPKGCQHEPLFFLSQALERSISIDLLC